MKALLVLSGAVLFLALMSGCEVSPGYGGAYGGVYGEYPTTYYGQYYSYPAYPYYGHSYYYRAPFDRDHYWDRDHRWGERRYRYRGHDRDDWHH